MTKDQKSLVAAALRALADANATHHKDGVRDAIGACMNILTSVLEELDGCRYHVERRKAHHMAGPTPAQAWHTLCTMAGKRISDEGNDEQALESVRAAMCDEFYANISAHYELYNIDAA